MQTSVQACELVHVSIHAYACVRVHALTCTHMHVRAKMCKCVKHVSVCAVPCRVVRYRAVPCRAVPCHAVLPHAVPCHVVSCCVMPCLTVLRLVVRVCVRACVRACVHACVCACACGCGSMHVHLPVHYNLTELNIFCQLRVPSVHMRVYARARMWCGAVSWNGVVCHRIVWRHASPLAECCKGSLVPSPPAINLTLLSSQSGHKRQSALFYVHRQILVSICF